MKDDGSAELKAEDGCLNKDRNHPKADPKVLLDDAARSSAEADHEGQVPEFVAHQRDTATPAARRPRPEVLVAASGWGGKRGSRRSCGNCRAEMLFLSGTSFRGRCSRIGVQRTWNGRPLGKLDLRKVAKQMRGIDFVMLQTRTEGGQIAGRPMSNNKDVEYDGDSYFFVMQDSRTVRDVRKDSQVNMALQSRMGLFGAPPLFISIEGTAEVILDKDMLRAHWRPTCSMPTTRARFMLRA